MLKDTNGSYFVSELCFADVAEVCSAGRVGRFAGRHASCARLMADVAEKGGLRVI